MADAGTISSTVPFLVATTARSEGADADAILAGTGLASLAPPRPDAHVSLGTYLGVWRRALVAQASAGVRARAACARWTVAR